MATHRIPILGFGMSPDSSGDVFIEPASVKFTNGLDSDLVLIFNDTATRDGCSFKFKVPENYVGTPKLIVTWTTTATSGDVEFDYDYTPVAIGETLDPAPATTSINQNDTAPGTALDMLEAELTLTANFAVGDLVKGTLFRDGTDGGDTMSAAAIIETVEFEYADA